MASLAVHLRSPFVGSRRGIGGAPQCRRTLTRTFSQPRAAAAHDVPGVTLRKGVSADLETIRESVCREKMNPLGLDPSRFVVAVDSNDPSSIIGFGQLKPWESLSNRPGDDVLGNVTRQLRLTPNWTGELLELSSLVVVPGKRGKGVGRAVARRLVEEAVVQLGDGSDNNANDASQGDTIRQNLRSQTLPTLCLLTLNSTTSFYEKLGFSKIVSNEYVPRPLRAELFLGGVVARIAVGDECVAMKMDWERWPGE
jgi:N-acetylglutamate synthase-like GNAT family acetyltransferase